MPLLLSYLNVSNSSNLLADSGFIFQDCLLAGMRRLGWETVLIGPDGSSPLTTSPVIEVDIPDTKYGVRYNFPWAAIEAALRGRRLRPDALLVNQPELALPLSALVDGHVGRRVPLGVYYHAFEVSELLQVAGVAHCLIDGDNLDAAYPKAPEDPHGTTVTETNRNSFSSFTSRYLRSSSRSRARSLTSRSGSSPTWSRR